MSTPWFLVCLGLDESADERAIKRAYASRLRDIDQATDIAGFERLHQAYKTSLDWLTRIEDARAPIANIALAIATPPTHAVTTRARQAPGLHNTPPPNEAPFEIATQAYQQLTEDLANGEDASKAFDHQMRILGNAHLQAPYFFELMLLDDLMQGRIAQRPALFALAQKSFDWADIGHLMSLGERGDWIMSLRKEDEAIQAAWWRLPTSIRWLGVLETGEKIPPDALMHWPELRSVLRIYPRYFALRVDARHIDAWEAAWKEAYPGFARDDGTKVQQQGPRPAGRPRQGSPAPAFGAVLVFGLFLAVQLFHLGLHDSRARQVPLPPALLASSSTPDCYDLYSSVHAVRWRLPQDEGQRRQLAASVRTCLNAGQWLKDFGADPVLPLLGITH